MNGVSDLRDTLRLPSRPSPRLRLAADAAAIQVTAHRGSSATLAEHTAAAYLQAMQEGADALECDIRLTRDGHLVCVHDRRVNRTSDGVGLVSTLELSDLAALDFGSWKQSTGSVDEAPDGIDDPSLGADEPDTDLTGVLTLRRLLSLWRDFTRDTGRQVQLHIECKHPTRYAGQVERELMSVLDDFGLRHPASAGDSAVVVMSFASSSLRRIRTLAPRLPTVLLFDRMPLLLRDGHLPAHADIAGPSLAVLRAHPRFVERAHAQGARVHCWTVDAREDIAYVIDLGVDTVISNRPADVLATLGRSSVSH